MDIELIKALGDLPVVAICIYLIIRTQGEKEKLLSELIASERSHAKDLVDIIVSGRVIVGNHPPTFNVPTLQSDIPEN